MLSFAHIPTGTTASKGLDTGKRKGRSVGLAIAMTVIGADIEIG
jgi:hypothetical protein